MRRYELTLRVLIPSQIIIPIQDPSPPSAIPRQYVRIHPKLLRLFELYRPSDALHQNINGRERKEEMRQSTSRAFHCGLRYLQHMSVARTLITPFTNEEGKSILGALARPLRLEGSQPPPISTDDAGDVEAQILGDFTIFFAHEGDQRREYRPWTRPSATEESPCSRCLATCPINKKAGNHDWTAQTVGFPRQLRIGLVEGRFRFRAVLEKTLSIWG